MSHHLDDNLTITTDPNGPPPDDDTVSISISSLQAQAEEMDTLKRRLDQALATAAAEQRKAAAAKAAADRALEAARSHQVLVEKGAFLRTWITELPHPGLIRHIDPDTGSTILYIGLILNKAPRVDTWGGKKTYCIAETILQDCIPLELPTPSGGLFRCQARGGLKLVLSRDSQVDLERLLSTGQLRSDCDHSDSGFVPAVPRDNPSTSPDDHSFSNDRTPTPPNTLDIKLARSSIPDAINYTRGQQARALIESAPDPSEAARYSGAE